MFYSPDWSLPRGVHALITTRQGGRSVAPFDSFNLAAHVGDELESVETNRDTLHEQIGHSVHWLSQVHSTKIIDLDRNSHQIAEPSVADGAYSRDSHTVCGVMTADCLPLLLCSQDGKEVAALHAGWRGLANGIVVEGVRRFLAEHHNILAYLGPAISHKYFEVGEDVLAAFKASENHIAYDQSVETFFEPRTATLGKYWCDLTSLAKSQLAALGVRDIAGGDRCTYSEAQHYYSFRRDGASGRFASLIWRTRE